MRIDIDIDDELLSAAMEASGMKTKDDTVREALEFMVRIRRGQVALHALRGKIEWEGDLDAMRRDKWSPREKRKEDMTGNDIYAAQHFGQKTGFGRRTALLVVDFVNGFVDPTILGGGNIVEAVAATVPLLAWFREAGLPVVFTRIVYAEDGSDAGLWCEKVPRLRGLTETADASQVVADLAPRPGELIVRKLQASAFFGTGLASILVARGVDTVLVTGCTTSGCIRATVIDAMSWNFRPVVARDCVGDRAIGPHDANLFDIGQKYADLLTGAEAIEALSHHSAAAGR